MKMGLLGIAAPAILALSALQGGAATLVIDSFDSPQTVVDYPAVGYVTSSQLADSSVLGGYRDLQIINVASQSVDEVFASSLIVASGSLSFSNQAFARGKGYITYDGDDDAESVNTAGLGGVNFLIGANPYFAFEVSYFDQPVDIAVTVWDTAGETVSYTETLVPGFSPNLYFSQLTGSSSFDWTSVGALQFFVDSTYTELSVDGALSSISIKTTPVPLPASALLLAGGLSGLAMMRRRKKSA